MDVVSGLNGYFVNEVNLKLIFHSFAIQSATASLTMIFDFLIKEFLEGEEIPQVNLIYLGINQSFY